MTRKGNISLKCPYFFAIKSIRDPIMPTILINPPSPLGEKNVFVLRHFAFQIPKNIKMDVAAMTPRTHRRQANKTI